MTVPNTTKDTRVEEGHGIEIKNRKDLEKSVEGDSNTSEDAEDTDEEAQQRRRLHNDRHMTADDMTMDDDDDDKEEEVLDTNVEEEKNGIIEEGIPETIYSIWFVCEPNSRAYWYAIGVWAVQITITMAALLDSFERSFPPGVSIFVTVAQGISIPIAVASNFNFIEGVIRVNDRANVTFANKMNFWSWVLSSMGQTFVGLGLLILVFVFTMQAESVFQVLVNIVALAAVGNISTTGYVMASKGFVGYKIWKDTRKVTAYKLKRRYKSSTKLLQFLYVATTATMYIAFGLIVHRQLTGFYHCKSIYLQFSDEIQTNLPYLSGVYTMRDKRLNHRFIHEDASTGQALFIGYCKSQTSFGLAEVSDTINASHVSFDPCDSWVLSQKTHEYDVSRAGDLPWRVRSIRDEAYVDTKSFTMQCVDCDTLSCLPTRGTCKNNVCVCVDGRYGINCEFQNAPEQIVVNANKQPFPPVPSLVNEDDVILPLNYTLLRNDDGSLALAYHRPVYYSEGFEFIILFSGRRWSCISPWAAVSRSASLFRRRTEEGTAGGGVLQPSIDDVRVFILSSISNLNLFDVLSLPQVHPFTVSEEIDVGGTLDNGTPLGVHWIGTRIVRGVGGAAVVAIDTTVVYDAVFISGTCDLVLNQCQNFGVCVLDESKNHGFCDCSSDLLGFPTHSGALCEKSLTCNDIQASILPTGCFGGYDCVKGEAEEPTCSCLDDFPDAGRFCQWLPCYHPNALFPGGCANSEDNVNVCNNITGDCVCDPDSAFTGKYCQTLLPPCDEESAVELYGPNGCSGRGACTSHNDTSSSFCICDERFSGRYCENEIQACYSSFMQDLHPPNGCANGFQCNATTGLCDCDGSKVFAGSYCEEAQLPCDDPLVLDIFPDNGCANGGACDRNISESCWCTGNFTGAYCQNQPRIPGANRTL
jgi:hypothetical protein